MREFDAVAIAGLAIAAIGTAYSQYQQGQAEDDAAAASAAALRLEAQSIRQQIKLEKVDLARQVRDLSVTRRRQMSRIKAVLSANGGAGLSSQLARVVIGEAEGEFAITETRLRQDTEIRVTGLNERRKNLAVSAAATTAAGSDAASSANVQAGLGLISSAISGAGDVAAANASTGA